MKKLLVLSTGMLFLVGGTTGCLDVEYGLGLERDLSGTATIDLDIDLERMAYVSAKIQRMFSGTEGEPTEQEIEAARRELVSGLEEQEEFSEEGLREEIEPDLPEGVELLDVELEEEDLGRHIRVTLAFDHVNRLKEMDVGPEPRPGPEPGAEGEPEAEVELEAGPEPEPGTGGEAGTEGDAGTAPFGDLEVIDEGETILITNAPVNPVAEVQGQAHGGMPNMEGLLVDAFEGLRVAFSLRAPFEIVEHNATRVEGETLWWEFDLATLTREGGEAPRHIMVRYRK